MTLLRIGPWRKRLAFLTKGECLSSGLKPQYPPD